MPVQIKNLSSMAMYVPLHNGENVRLAPGERSPSLPDAQVQGQAKIEKLLKQRMIAVESRDDPDQAKGKAEAEATGPENRTRPRAAKSISNAQGE